MSSFVGKRCRFFFPTPGPFRRAASSFFVHRFVVLFFFSGSAGARRGGIPCLSLPFFWGGDFSSFFFLLTCAPSLFPLYSGHLRSDHVVSFRSCSRGYRASFWLRHPTWFFPLFFLYKKAFPPRELLFRSNFFFHLPSLPLFEVEENGCPFRYGVSFLFRIAMISCEADRCFRRFFLILLAVTAFCINSQPGFSRRARACSDPVVGVRTFPSPVWSGFTHLLLLTSLS